MQRVASGATLLDITLARRKTRRFDGYLDMLNIVSSKAPGERASMSAKNGSIKLVAGNSNPALAQENRRRTLDCR